MCEMKRPFLVILTLSDVIKGDDVALPSDDDREESVKATLESAIVSRGLEHCREARQRRGEVTDY